MKEANITVPILAAQYNELDANDRKLIDTAREATTRSYAPYSRFRVGAAILLDNGEIVAGSNQENAAFPPASAQNAPRRSMPTPVIPMPNS